MGFKCGIVGLPNVGKSSLFNALTSSTIAVENYPFCTIEPNVGIVAVPDPRLERIAEIVGPQKTVPAIMEFVDIAGLVAGASKGEGLGNQFLSHIRETQAIAHIARCFDDDNVTHVAGRIDPIADIDVVETELALADLDTVSRGLERAEKQTKTGDKDARTRADCFAYLVDELASGVPVRAMRPNPDTQNLLPELALLTAQPVLFVANVDESNLAGNSKSNAVDEYAAACGAQSVVLCVAIEAEIAALDFNERAEFLVELGLEEPGLNRVIRAGYKLLGLHHFFSADAKECRAWAIPHGTPAATAGGVIHADFKRGFIRAEVVTYEDFVAYNGEAGARDAGRLRIEGRDYLVADGDVIRFKI